MSVSETFLDMVRDLFGFVPELRIKRMFGGAGVFSGGLMFGLAAEEALYLRADPESRGLFVAEGSVQFTYAAKNGERMSLGYWRAPDAVWDDREAARRWSGVALEAALRKKANPRRPGGKAPKRQALLIPGPWDEDG